MEKKRLIDYTEDELNLWLPSDWAAIGHGINQAIAAAYHTERITTKQYFALRDRIATRPRGVPTTIEERVQWLEKQESELGIS